MGYPGGSVVESACQCRRRGFNPCIRKIPHRRKWQSNPVFLPGKSHDQRSLVSHGIAKDSGLTKQLNNNKLLNADLMRYSVMHNIRLYHPSPQNFTAETFCCFLLSQSISFILASFYSPFGSKYRGSSFQHCSH